MALLPSFDKIDLGFAAFLRPIPWEFFLLISQLNNNTRIAVVQRAGYRLEEISEPGLARLPYLPRIGG
jgi:hypothetical protein